MEMGTLTAAPAFDDRNDAPQLLRARAAASAPGRVDSLPTSTMSAPSAVHLNAGFDGGRGVDARPPSAKRVGRDVEDAHDEARGPSTSGARFGSGTVYRRT